MKTEVPTNLNDDPRFSAATALLEKLKADLQAVEKRIEENLSTLSAASEARRNRIEEQAHAMLAGQPDAALNASAETARIRADIEAAQLKRPALHRAIELQRHFVEQLRGELHAKICRDLAPKHIGLVREVAKRLIDLDAALMAEHDLREEIFHGTGLHGLTPMMVGNLGLLRDEYSLTAIYLIECVKNGFLKKSELPEHLRGRVPSHDPAPTPTVQKRQADPDGWLHATA